MKKEEVKNRKYEFLHYFVVFTCICVVGWWSVNYVVSGQQSDSKPNTYYQYPAPETTYHEGDEIILVPPEKLFKDYQPLSQNQRVDQSADWFQRLLDLIETVTPLVVPFITYFLYRKEKNGSA